MTDPCPHCPRTITDADIWMLDILDWSGCPLNPPCPPRATPCDEWPGDDEDDEGDDEGEDEPEPVTPKEGQTA